MTRIFTEEWLAARELRQAQRIGKPTPQEKAQIADRWNGNVDTDALGNCEVVDSLSGGTDGRADHPRDRSHLSEGGKVAQQRHNTVAIPAGIKPGPLTINAARLSSRPSQEDRGAAPIYALVGLCRGAGLPVPVPEYSFALPARQWRFDYAWPMQMLALEIDGGVWTQGRHTRGQGAIDDMEKMSEAAILGWRVLYVIPKDLRSGVALDRLMRALSPPKRAA